MAKKKAASYMTPGEKIAGTIDDEVKALIDRAYRHCEDILRRDADKLNRITEFLLAHETMSGTQFAECMAGKEISADAPNSLFDAFTSNGENE